MVSHNWFVLLFGASLCPVYVKYSRIYQVILYQVILYSQRCLTYPNACTVTGVEIHLFGRATFFCTLNV